MNMNQRIYFQVDLTADPTVQDKAGCDGIHVLDIRRISLTEYDTAVLNLLEEVARFEGDAVEPYRFNHLLESARLVRGAIIKRAKA